MAVIESRSDSPRTSISYDFGPPDTIASVEKLTNQSSSLSNVGSDFCFQRNNDNQESLSTAADELFLNGKILPAQINKRIDSGSSKQILQPILVVPPFPPLHSYVHTNNSRRRCSEVNKIGNKNHESPSSDNSLVLSVKHKKKISGTKLMQSKPFPPLHDLLYGAKTSVSNEAINSKSSFKVGTGAGNGEEHGRKELKPTRCSLNCFGLKFTSGNGLFGGGICPFPLVFRSYSVGSVQNSSKVVSSLPRNSQIHQQNPMKLKHSTSPVRNRSPSLKQLILTEHKLHSTSRVRNRSPSLKQLILTEHKLHSTSPVRNRSPSLKQLILTEHKLQNSFPVRNRKPSLEQLIVGDSMME